MDFHAKDLLRVCWTLRVSLESCGEQFWRDLEGSEHLGRACCRTYPFGLRFRTEPLGTTGGKGAMDSVGSSEHVPAEVRVQSTGRWDGQCRASGTKSDMNDNHVCSALSRSPHEMSCGMGRKNNGSPISVVVGRLHGLKMSLQVRN